MSCYRHSVWLSVLVLLCLSCASRQAFIPITTEEKTRVFEHPFDEVWESLVYVLNENEQPISTIEKESGIIVTDFVRFDPYSTTAKECIHTQTLETVRECRYKLNILVMNEGPKSTAVRVNAHIEKFSKPFLMDYSWTSQMSNGYLERRIFDELDDRLWAERTDYQKNIGWAEHFEAQSDWEHAEEAYSAALLGLKADEIPDLDQMGQIIKTEHKIKEMRERWAPDEGSGNE